MIIIGVSAPVGGVVAFYIQLKNIKRIDLQNEKLNLEIIQLKEESHKLKSQIKIPTNEEVKKYSQYDEPMYYRCSSGRTRENSLFTIFLSIDWGSLFIAVLVVSFIGYFFYDVYRVGLWFLNKF